MQICLISTPHYEPHLFEIGDTNCSCEKLGLHWSLVGLARHGIGNLGSPTVWSIIAFTKYFKTTTNSNQCDIASSQAGKLKTHTGEKSNKCKQCSLALAASGVNNCLVDCLLKIFQHVDKHVTLNEHMPKINAMCVLVYSLEQFIVRFRSSTDSWTLFFFSLRS